VINRLLLSVLIAGSLFGAIVYFELQPTAADDEVVATLKGVPEVAKPSPRQQDPRIGDPVAIALAKPLFSPTRRPPQSTQAGAAEDNDLADTRLAGIVTTPARRLAIFAVKGDKPLKRVEGDEVSGWRIESITPREVSLSGPSGTKTLQPKFDPNLVPPAVKPPPGGARLPNAPGAAMPQAPVPAAAVPGRPSPLPLNAPGALPRPARARPPR
jgi:hypothetical protein